MWVDDKEEMNKLLVKARELMLTLEQNIDDDSLKDNSEYSDIALDAITTYLEAVKCRCENCGKKIPQDQLDDGNKFCSKKCNKDYFII